jgi:hypothetical protein
MALVYAPRKKRSRRKSVAGDGRAAVRSAFAQAAKYCAVNRSPGERIQDCIRRVFHQYYKPA